MQRFRNKSRSKALEKVDTFTIYQIQIEHASVNRTKQVVLHDFYARP
jgi:hypothetical protein